MSAADCSAGGATVVARENWYLVEETDHSGGRSSRKYRAYQCRQEHCKANNTCEAGRIGVLCGACPPDHVLEANACKPCTESPQTLQEWRVVFSVVCAVVFSMFWILLSWSPVAGETASSLFYSWFGWPIRMLKKLRGLYETASGIEEGVQQAKTFSKDKTSYVRTAQQYFKIAIAYGQVTAAFIRFKVVWPESLMPFRPSGGKNTG